MSETGLEPMLALGFTDEQAAQMIHVGLAPEDLDGWNPADAMTLALAVDHQGIDPATVAYLFNAHTMDISAAFEDMVADSD